MRLSSNRTNLVQVAYTRSMRNTYCLLALPLAALTIALTACEIDNDVPTGPLKDEKVAIDLNKAERAYVELDMAAGEMDIRGGTPRLLSGNLEYNVPDWKPEITSSQDGGVANVTIRQPKHAGARNTRYQWNLNVNERVPLDLKLNCGAGEAKLNLGDMNLRTVSVQMGAGKVDLSLEGHPTHDYSVNINGGVGEAIIHLPQGVGIRAEAHGGLGSIDVQGLTKHADYYSNDLYGKSDVNVALKRNGGLGEIRILD